MRRSVCVLAILALGCALDRAGIGAPGGGDAPLDGGEPAKGELDAGSPDGAPGDAREETIDSGIDAYVPIEPIDAGIDAPPPEEPDAWTPPPRTCDEVYGDVRSYLACPAPISDCAFYTDPMPDTSCTELCALRGGACIQVIEDLANDCAGTVGLDCATVFNDMVCACTLPR